MNIRHTLITWAYGRPFVSKLVMTTLCKKWSHRAMSYSHHAITVTHRAITMTHRAIAAVTSHDVIQHRATTPHNDIALLGRAAASRDGHHQL